MHQRKDGAIGWQTQHVMFYITGVDQVPTFVYVQESLKLTAQQRDELMQLRQWVLPQVGRLMRERERISRSLQACTSDSNNQQACHTCVAGPSSISSHAAWCSSTNEFVVPDLNKNKSAGPFTVMAWLISICPTTGQRQKPLLIGSYIPPFLTLQG